MCLRLLISKIASGVILHDWINNLSCYSVPTDGHGTSNKMLHQLQPMKTKVKLC